MTEEYPHKSSTGGVEHDSADFEGFEISPWDFIKKNGIDHFIGFAIRDLVRKCAFKEERVKNLQRAQKTINAYIEIINASGGDQI